MIDEKKLINSLHKMEKIWNGNECLVNFSRIIGYIENQPKIGGWIPCSERLPEEKTNPVTSDFYEYQVTYKSESVTDVRHYKFGRGHWWNGAGTVDEYVIAWKERPEAYHEQVD